MADDLKVAGFKSSELISSLGTAFASFSPAEKASQIKKTNGIFEITVNKPAGESPAAENATWTIDLKKTGTVTKGKAATKADVTIIMDDEVFVDLASGKLNGQKAFMTGKLKTKGNIMLATKLDGVLKSAQGGAKAKL
ncbi:sterol-binding protein [Gymnopus androsaceus JB14]|uniref:Sterol-binding protein n=1 Tax=Gymnopus androsaceus JB14 TaxID=1447944 RepID=A0A6A4ID59_9AGAR|nr:sterol-binding protein [Gymnopus androsaceus JB14]